MNVSLGWGRFVVRKNSIVEPENKQDVNARCFTEHGLRIGVLYKNRVRVQLKCDGTR